jgi:hypothetical protein
MGFPDPNQLGRRVKREDIHTHIESGQKERKEG